MNADLAAGPGGFGILGSLFETVVIEYIRNGAL